jgi:hypothetical protein
MALGLDISPLARVVEALAGETTPGEWISQLAIAAGALAAAWAIARALCMRVTANSKWKFGKGDFERVVFPLLAWLFVWIGQDVLARFAPADFLEVVLTLVAALVVIRAAVYVLGHVIPRAARSAR